jgi:hypothetical protein
MQESRRTEQASPDERTKNNQRDTRKEKENCLENVKDRQQCNSERASTNMHFRIGFGTDPRYK